jgi:RES domain-containing protein
MAPPDLARSEALVPFVPSVVARTERNLVVNAAHPDVPRIGTGLEMPVRWPVSWDDRQFAP